jgi:methionyl-tRNA formyltransferase
MPAPRVLFFGYSEVGYATLKFLLERGVHVVGVFTHDADPTEANWFRSVPALAQTHGLPVFAPKSLKDPEWEERVRELRPDLILSMYYRNLIPTRLLDLAPLGAFNLHGSLLPRFRGRAPLNWAIIHGENHTGLTLHVMVREADAGDVVDLEKIPIGADEAVTTVLPRIPEAAVRLLERQLPALLAGQTRRTPQDHSQATYFGKRTPEDGRIDWSRSAREIFNFVRAVTHPFPGAFTDITHEGHTARLLVWWGQPVEAPAGRVPGEILSLSPLTIACGQGAFAILESTWNSPGSSTPPTLRVGETIS